MGNYQVTDLETNILCEVNSQNHMKTGDAYAAVVGVLLSYACSAEGILKHVMSVSVSI